MVDPFVHVNQVACDLRAIAECFREHAEMILELTKERDRLKERVKRLEDEADRRLIKRGGRG
jgi:hypothetical protein